MHACGVCMRVECACVWSVHACVVKSMEVECACACS